MHVQLLVPALLDPKMLGPASGLSQAAASLPSAELLFARGRVSAAAVSMENWLKAAFELQAPGDAGLAACSALGDGLTTGSDGWLRADPVHLRINTNSIDLADSHFFPLQRDEAESLASHLNSHFAGSFEIVPATPSRWYVRLDQAPDLQCVPLPEVRGCPMDSSLPRGRDGLKWQSLMNEVQMVLHEHPINEAREARGNPAINSLWFWGSGNLPTPDSRPFDLVMADDPLARGMASASGAVATGLAADAAGWLDRLPQEGRVLVVLDSLRAASAYRDEAEWSLQAQTLDKTWIEPLLSALRQDRIGMLSLHAPSGEGKSVECIRNDLRRFWRRPKPLLHLARS